MQETPKYYYLLRLLILAAVAVVLATILYPLLILILYSLGIRFNGADVSILGYQQALTDTNTITAIYNTFYVAGGVSVLAVLLGGGLAWIFTRTDIPWKGFLKWMIFITFIIPSYIMAVSWIELLGRNGYVNRWLYESWHWLEQPIDIYTLEGIILVMTIHLFPLVFLTLSSALQMNDLSLEKAARLSGAGTWRTMLTVSLPLVLPSILSIGLLVFQHTMACFGVAAVLGLPTGNYILTTSIYTALNQLNLPLATASSIILLLCSGVVFAVYSLSLRKKKYINISSRSQLSETRSLGKWRIPVFIMALAVLSITTVIPLGTIILSSFLKQWGMDLSLASFTLGNYQAVFANDGLGMRAIRNSIVFGIAAASVASIIGVVTAWTVNRTSLKGRYLMEFAATWPVAIPGTVLAVAAILGWINPPVKLYGTPWVLMFAYIAACLPFTVRSISGPLQGIDISLEQSARIAGATAGRAFGDISLPVITSGIRNGWIMSFLLVLREIPISILLYTAGFETIGVLLFNMRSDTGGLETVSAIAVIVIVITLIGNLLIEKVGKSRMEGI